MGDGLTDEALEAIGVDIEDVGYDVVGIEEV